MSTEEWGSELGLKVLKKLSKLYLNLVWESTVLLAICSGEYKPGPGEFARTDLDILVPPSKYKDTAAETDVSLKVATFNIIFSGRKYWFLIAYFLIGWFEFGSDGNGCLRCASVNISC